MKTEAWKHCWEATYWKVYYRKTTKEKRNSHQVWETKCPINFHNMDRSKVMQVITADLLHITSFSWKNTEDKICKLVTFLLKYQ